MNGHDLIPGKKYKIRFDDPVQREKYEVMTYAGEKDKDSHGRYLFVDKYKNTWTLHETCVVCRINKSTTMHSKIKSKRNKNRQTRAKNSQ